MLIPTDQIDHDDIRAHGDLTALAQSMKLLGQLQPIVVRENPPGSPRKYTATVGNRRVGAAKLAGITQINAILQVFGAENKTLAQIAENHNRTSMEAVELVAALAKADAENPGRQKQEIAEATGCSPSELSKCLTIWGCSVAMPAMRSGKITSLEAADIVAKAPEANKDGLLALHTSGATVKQLAEAAKPKRKQTVKVDRVKLAFLGGSVTVAAPELDLAGLIDTLGAILEQARKANKESLDIKTFARVLGDKAKVQS